MIIQESFLYTFGSMRSMVSDNDSWNFSQLENHLPVIAILDVELAWNGESHKRPTTDHLQCFGWNDLVVSVHMITM